MSTEQRPDPLAAAAAAANVAYEKLVADYAKTPDAIAARAREQIHRLNSSVDAASAQEEVAALERQIQAAERGVPEAMSEAARIALAIDGRVDFNGIETRVNQQIPARDLVSAVGDLVERGVRPETLQHFLQTGQGGDPNGREAEIAAAARWRQKLETDPVMQQKLLSKDPKTMEEFVYYGIYAAGPTER
jgi:hypothetical protein